MIKGIVEYVLCCSQWKLITVGEIRSQSSVSIMLEYRWFPPKDGVYHKRLKSFLKENSCLHALPLKCDTFFNFHTVKAELFHKESREYDCSFRKNSNPLGSHVLAPLGARKWFKTSSTYLPITYNHWTSIAIIIYYSYGSTRRYLIANYLVLHSAAKAFLNLSTFIYLDFTKYFHTLSAAIFQRYLVIQMRLKKVFGSII